MYEHKDVAVLCNVDITIFSTCIYYYYCTLATNI